MQSCVIYNNGTKVCKNKEELSDIQMTAAEQDLSQCLKTKFGSLCHGEDGDDSKVCLHTKLGSICYSENDESVCVHNKYGSDCTGEQKPKKEEEDMAKMSSRPENMCRITNDKKRG